uniref:Uncharacterized protein MANES_03G041100 n=1 Tax=Rhizophora mucronata TaxID=61149 RepID=A0A2P2Q4Q7_RHIMU
MENRFLAKLPPHFARLFPFRRLLPVHGGPTHPIQIPLLILPGAAVFGERAPLDPETTAGQPHEVSNGRVVRNQRRDRLLVDAGDHVFQRRGVLGDRRRTGNWVSVVQERRRRGCRFGQSLCLRLTEGKSFSCLIFITQLLRMFQGLLINLVPI